MSRTGIARGITPWSAASAAATPAAWPVSQHCGISRMKPWRWRRRNVAAGRQQAVQPLRHQRAVGDRDVGELGRQRGETPISSPAPGLRAIAARDRVDAARRRRMAHAELRRGQHEVGALEARAHGPGRTRGGAAISRWLRISTSVRSSTSSGGEADQARPHEQRDIVAPGDEGAARTARSSRGPAP